MGNVFLALFALVVVKRVQSHGMMLDPPNRSSLWRFDPTAPINYNDNENFCGGFTVQWNQNGGKCGVCGDNYLDPVPRKNENTGKYGQGKIVRNYRPGSVINVTVLLTANHKGWFTYSICNLTDPSKPERDDCFQPLRFEDGGDNVSVPKEQKDFYNTLVLPNDFVCDHCVLRWNYKAGNNWGTCANGTGAVGCGPQEIFRSCADISINF